MAAQNLTASALTYVQARLESMFAPGTSTPSRYPWVNHVATAQAMLSEHRANTSPIFDEQQNCVGYRVYWLQKGDTTMAYNGTPGSFTYECTIPSGQGPTSAEKIYTNNFLALARIEVNDNLCGNVFRNPGSTLAQQASAIIMERFDTALHELRAAINAKFITFLDTNKTPINNDASLPSGITFGSSTFTVDESILSMQEPDTLTDIEALIQNNDMPGNSFYLGGRYHFYNARENANFRQNNDNERDHARLLTGSGMPMYHDIKNLDSTLSGYNSFVVDPGSYVFWDFVNKERSTTPVLVDDDTWEYYMNEPLLSIGGRPLYVNIRYQRTCNGGNTNLMTTTSTHRWEVFVHGGLYVAPASEDTHTGIMKLKSA